VNVCRGLEVYSCLTFWLLYFFRPTRFLCGVLEVAWLDGGGEARAGTRSR
jgi:hypothetical protein